MINFLFGRRKPSWAIRFVLICIGVFILQVFSDALTQNLLLVSNEFWLRPWTLVTHAFLHGSALHLFYNMFALALFGILLERIISSRNFLILYFSALFASAVASIYFYDATLGASGAIFGIMGMLAVLRPKMIVWVLGIPMPMAIAAVFWGAGDFIGLFLPGATANAAHLAGLFIGLVFGFIFFKQYGEFPIKKKSEIQISEEDLDKWEREWM